LAIFQSFRKDAFEALDEASDFESVHKVESDYLGKNGRLSNILKSLKEMPPAERKIMGSAANVLKKEIEEKIKLKKSQIGERSSVRNASDWIDVTVPGKKISRGHLHPITQVLREVAAIFESMGFEIVEGPEAETEYYNFDALNIPKNHPARDMWDTFWLKPLKNR
jgi:phenylalanyl-tRNA synthetase alpha chain